MAASIFEEMGAYVGFTEEDAANLRALGEPIDGCLPALVERFYAEARKDVRARQLLGGSPEEFERLRSTMMQWLRGLFCGKYDAGYVRERELIGRVHVRIGLPQHFMIVALEVIWQELQECIKHLPVRRKQAKLASLHKLLMLELGIMLQSYRDSHDEHIRTVERDAMRARLNEAEQLAHVGQLAASLAHEIKNPLAGISGAIQIIRGSMKPDQAHWSVLGEVQRQIQRLDRTVKDLLVYARPKPPRSQHCELPRLVERVLSLLKNEPTFERVRVDVNMDGDLPELHADENLLEQLLMNLLLNAAQASPAGGAVRFSASPQNGGVRLIVADRGGGMSPDVARRAMEPFFTTKARGTGLGLPICRKIAEAHGGTITIQSQPGVGTEVVVDLLQQGASAGTGLRHERTGPDR